MAKKKKEKDFQKIKLKVGRKLLRGTNDTKTEFKSKKIILKESESRSKDPIKTLTNCIGINSQLKQLCLNRVYDSLNSTNINTNSGQLINTVSKYLNDEDNRVRTDAIKCIKQCIALLDNNNNNKNNKNAGICPLMAMILTYVNCGMTHINPNIANDSIKLFSYIIEKCDYSSFDQLMQITFTRIANKSIIDVNEYEICYKIVSLMRRHDCNNQMLSKPKESPVFKWSTDNSYCDLSINTDNKPSLEFNITFQMNSSVDIKEKFLTVIRNIVSNDLKLLFPKESKGLSFSITEARKAISALNISAIIGSSFKGIEGEIPSVNIVAINANKKSNRQQQQLISHLKHELIISLNNLFKVNQKSEKL